MHMYIEAIKDHFSDDIHTVNIIDPYSCIVHNQVNFNSVRVRINDFDVDVYRYLPDCMVQYTYQTYTSEMLIERIKMVLQQS